MNIEQIRTFGDRIDSLTELANKVSKQYYTSRYAYSDAFNKVHFAVAKSLTVYRSKKSNIGIEMAMLWKLEDSIKSGDQEFQDNYEAMNLERGRYKGLEQSLEVIKGEMIAITALMKYNKEGMDYGE